MTRALPALSGLLALLAFAAPQSFAQGKYQTLGMGGCGTDQNNCHVKEYKIYKNDPHQKTLEKLYDDEEKAKEYGEKLGIKDIYKSNSSCMKCHGTIVSGKSAVEDGVSCESCHGAGSGYKEPHKEGTGGGVQRPGYAKGLATGMLELKNLDTRAKLCVSCHYVTDQKLAATGHKNGAGFNYVSGIKTVAKHWKRAITPDETQKALFTKALGGRGPAAQVASAPAPPPQPAAAAQQSASAPSGAPAASMASTGSVAPRPARRPPPPPRTPAPEPIPATPDPGTEEAPAATLGLPPFPALSDSIPLRQQLLLIKQRIELLYERTK
ncbi:MAG: hypothetical protein IPP94_16755 [Ignavibacteria bacterium]|nr:hypothetical protein [Ignavibacteria bacterium]